eukprot:jgi/Bigna1/63851/fgenesh1_kg.61_\
MPVRAQSIENNGVVRSPIAIVVLSTRLQAKAVRAHSHRSVSIAWQGMLWL